MKYTLLVISLLAALTSIKTLAASKISDEASLKSAIAMANADSSINKIVFAKNAHIRLTSPVIYTGSQDLILSGNESTIDGNMAGSFVLDTDLTAITTDGTLVFKTAGDIVINKLTIINSAARGIVVNIPDDAQGNDSKVVLHKVNILNSALYGLHIDDNADEFDEGDKGSAVGVELNISQSSFIGNGLGAIDFDGIRIDERGRGGISVMITDTHIDGNGGDGLELDEAGKGNVKVSMQRVTLNDNGFYNKEDLDDGFDIDEAGKGDIEVSLSQVEVNRNRDEGLDFDEQGEGSVVLLLRGVVALDNTDEGIKVDEQDAGNIEAKVVDSKVMGNGDEGLQLSELGEGRIVVQLQKVSAADNKGYGVKIEQWFVEDEKQPVEEAGSVTTKELILSDNGKGNGLKVHNVIVE